MILNKVSNLSNKKKKEASTKKTSSLVHLTKKEGASREKFIKKSSSSLTKKRKHESVNKSTASLPKQRKLSVEDTVKKPNSILSHKGKSSIETTISKTSSHLSRRRISPINVHSPTTSPKIHTSPSSRTQKRANQILDCQRILSRVRETILGFDAFNNSNRDQAGSDTTATEKDPISEGITRISTIRKTPVKNGNQVIRVSTTRRSNRSPTGLVSVSTTKKINASDELITAVAGEVSPQIGESNNILTETDSVMLGSTVTTRPLTLKTSSYVETEISLHPMSSFNMGCPLHAESQRIRSTDDHKSAKSAKSLTSATSSVSAGSPLTTSPRKNFRSPIRSKEIVSPARITSANSTYNGKKNREDRLQPKKSQQTNTKKRSLTRHNSPETDEKSVYVTPKMSHSMISKSRSVPIRQQSPPKKDSSLHRPQTTSVSVKSSKCRDKRNSIQRISAKNSRRKMYEMATKRDSTLRTNGVSPTRVETGRLSGKASTVSRISRFSRLDALSTPKRCASNTGLVSTVTAKRIATKRAEVEEIRRKIAEQWQREYLEREERNKIENKPISSLGLSRNNRVAIQSYVKYQQRVSKCEENISELKIVDKKKKNSKPQRTHSSNVSSNIRNVAQNQSCRGFANFSNIFNRKPTIPQIKPNSVKNEKPLIASRKTSPQKTTGSKTMNRVKSKTKHKQNTTTRKKPISLARFKSVPNTHRHLSGSGSNESFGGSENSGRKKRIVKGLKPSTKKVRKNKSFSGKVIPFIREHDTAIQAQRKSSIALAKTNSIMRFTPISEASSMREYRTAAASPDRYNLQEKKSTLSWLENNSALEINKPGSRSKREIYSAILAKANSSQRPFYDNLYPRDSRITHPPVKVETAPHRRLAYPLPEIYNELTPPVKNYLTPEEICKISLRMSKEKCGVSSSQRLSDALEARLQKLEAARRRFQSQNLWAKSSLSRLNMKNSMMAFRRTILNPLSLSPSIIPIKKEQSPHVLLESELSTVTPPSPETNTKEYKTRKKPTVIKVEPVSLSPKKKFKSSGVTFKSFQFPVRKEDNQKHQASPTRNNGAFKRLISPVRAEDGKIRKILVSKIIMNRASSATAPELAPNKNVSVCTTLKKSTATQPEIVVEVSKDKEEATSEKMEITDETTQDSSEQEYSMKTWNARKMCQECASKSVTDERNETTKCESTFVPFSQSKKKTGNRKKISFDHNTRKTYDSKETSHDLEYLMEDHIKTTSYDVVKKHHEKVAPKKINRLSSEFAKPNGDEEHQHKKPKRPGREIVENSVDEEGSIAELDVGSEKYLEQKLSDEVSLASSAPRSRVPISELPCCLVV